MSEGRSGSLSKAERDRIWRSAAAPYIKILEELEVPEGPKLDHSDISILYLLTPGIFKKKTEATRNKKQLDRCIRELTRLRFAFGGLDPKIVDRMEDEFGLIVREVDEQAEPGRKRKRDAKAERWLRFEERHKSFADMFEALNAELEVEKERVTREVDAHWSGPGKSREKLAREIALSVARIYVKLREQLPTFGAHPNTGEPTTDYTRTVKEIFELRGIDTPFHWPCRDAIEQIDNGEAEP